MKTLRVTTSLTAAQRIGRHLRELRKERGFTGEELARLIGISQSRISKIENGYSDSIVVEQIEALLKILKPTKTIRQQISVLMFQLVNNSDVQLTYPFAEVPDVFNDLQKTTSVFRSYIVCGVSAVLQTNEYRVAYLKRLGLSGEDTQLELGKTIERQDALWNLSKTFYMVMPEAALYTLPANSQVQIAQMDRLERIIGASNIHIGIIPMQAGLSVFETGSFSLYDDCLLFITTGDRAVRVTDNEVLLKYLNAFSEMSQMASFDHEAIEFIRKAADYFKGLL